MKNDRKRLGEILDLMQKDHSKLDGEGRRNAVLHAKDLGLSLWDEGGKKESLDSYIARLTSLEANPSSTLSDRDNIWRSFLQLQKQTQKILTLIYESLEGGGAIKIPLLAGLSWPPSDRPSPYDDFGMYHHLIGEPSNINISVESHDKETGLKKIIAEFEINISVVCIINSFINVPTSCFKKCPDCGKFFIQTTKREKAFCSRNCKSRNYMKLKKQEG